MSAAVWWSDSPMSATARSTATLLVRPVNCLTQWSRWTCWPRRRQEAQPRLLDLAKPPEPRAPVPPAWRESAVVDCFVKPRPFAPHHGQYFRHRDEAIRFADVWRFRRNRRKFWIFGAHRRPPLRPQVFLQRVRRSREISPRPLRTTCPVACFVGPRDGRFFDAFGPKRAA